MRARHGTVTKEKPFVIVVAIVACVFAFAAVLYLTLSPAHLPNFLPGHLARTESHPAVYTARAAVCALVAAVLAFIAWTDSSYSRRRRRRRRDAHRTHRSSTRAGT